MPRRKRSDTPDGGGNLHKKSKVVESEPQKPLEMVFTARENPHEIEVDIIAIHGLNTNPERSFVAHETEGDKNSRPVHWLRSKEMLPAKLGEIPARIFTYTWNSATFDNASDDYFHQHAEAFLREIESTRNDTKTRHVPIVFIASCFGGLVLAKALLLASEEKRSRYKLIVKGIVFLGTPFRGSGAISAGNMLVLLKQQIFGGTASSSLFKVLGEEPGDRNELTDNFVTLAERENWPMVMFFEDKETNIMKDRLPNWARELFKSKSEFVLVPRESACLDGRGEKIRLPVKHALLNKFRGPEDENYRKVSGSILSLVSQAILTHKASFVDQATSWIRNNCYARENLVIERLSGSPLQIEQCYINLAIVTKRDKYSSSTKGGDSGQESSQLSLATRLRVDNSKADVTLPTLFNPREIRDGHSKRPSRILIQGDAGVGKTTLCKKTVYEFIYGDMWQDLFDCVLWVRLRELKRWPYPDYNGQRMLFYLYFQEQADHGENLARELWKTIVDENTSVDATQGRTLFILDGLDEIPELLVADHPASKFLKSLLNRPNVIITCRPHAANWPRLDGFDLELETIGFDQKQVNDYLEAVLKDEEKVDKIQVFLENHYLVQTLVRIPIQLDALCYIWEDGDKKLRSEDALQTMTSVYQYIEQRLWTKDIAKLQTLITGDQLQRLRRKEIDNAVKYEKSLLLFLAFTGMCSGAMYFGGEDLDAILEHIGLSRPGLSIDKTLSLLSFLRTSDPSSMNPNYHFLHRTFQEYFAAQYFVQHWPDKQLPQLEMTAKEFLRKEKYNPHFDIMWTFVAGLIHASGTAKHFFEAIEAKPYDLLGPTHQRLVMRCLAEVQPRETANLDGLRNDLENRLKKWFLWELDVTNPVYGSDLATGMEFPEQILQECLEMGIGSGTEVMIALRSRPSVSSRMGDYLTRYLEKGHPEAMTREVLKLFYKHPTALPKRFLHKVVAILKSTSSSVRDSAALALSIQPDWPDTILSELAALLNGPDPEAHDCVAISLSEQSELPKEILLRIAALQVDATKVFNKQSRLAEEVVQEVLDMIQVSPMFDPNQLFDFMGAVFKDSTFPAKTIEKLLLLLNHPHLGPSWVVMYILLPQPAALLNLVALLNGPRQDDAKRVLASRENLPQNVLQEVVILLQDPNSDIQKAAKTILSKQHSEFPEVILQEVVGLLDDPARRLHGAEALYGQKSLPGNVLQKLIVLLQDPDPDIQYAVTHILNCQTSAFTEDSLQHVSNLLDDPKTKFSATYALAKQPYVPAQIVQKVQVQYRDQTTHSSQQYLVRGQKHTLREVQIRFLCNQPTLSNETLEEFVDLLEGPDTMLQSAIGDALCKRSALSERIVEKLANLLYWSNSSIREAAAKVLSRQSSLPVNILRKMLALVGDERKSVRDAAMATLRRQSLVSHEIVPDLVAMLESPSSEKSMMIAKEVLMEQRLSLPDSLLQRIIRLLSPKTDPSYLMSLLFGMTDLSETVLEEVMCQSNSSYHARDPVVSILEMQQSALTEKILYGLVANLKNGYNGPHMSLLPGAACQNRIVRMVLKQPALPEKILQLVKGLLNHPKRDVWSAAATILSEHSAISDATFTSLLGQMDRQSLKNLYQFWLERSFSEPLTWLTDGETSYINLPGRDKSVCLGQFTDTFKDVACEVRASLGIPSPEFYEVVN
ncbi:hypothetical protein F4803DRAFT_555268 [Xylaria telfairii]|nr:hypothetical protein F4803DRAFT_555268 [Xylaria telfairii]